MDEDRTTIALLQGRDVVDGTEQSYGAPSVDERSLVKARRDDVLGKVLVRCVILDPAQTGANASYLRRPNFSAVVSSSSSPFNATASGRKSVLKTHPPLGCPSSTPPGESHRPLS
jgi:hypothetical protein